MELVGIFAGVKPLNSTRFWIMPVGIHHIVDEGAIQVSNYPALGFTFHQAPIW